MRDSLKNPLHFVGIRQSAPTVKKKKRKRAEYQKYIDKLEQKDCSKAIEQLSKDAKAEIKEGKQKQDERQSARQHFVYSLRLKYVSRWG